MTDPALVDASAQADLVRRGEVTPIELVDAAIARIEQLNPTLNAVIHPRFDQARAEARAYRRDGGPFAGVPYLLKDFMGYLAGEPMHLGTRVLRDADFRAPHDSFLAAKFRAAGFVCLGRTNTPEFGILPTTEPDAYGPSRNPWDPGRSTGGSSGGSAAAVASGMVALAHANDGGGSIRIPASACGLVGLKPSRGRISAGPDMGELVGGFAMEGVLSRTVRDTAAVLDLIAGSMPGDPYAAPPFTRPLAVEVGTPPGTLRVGLLTRAPGGMRPLHADCVAAAEDVARLLESLGHRVEASHPEALDDPEALQQFSLIFSTQLAHTVELVSGLIGRALGPEDVDPLNWTMLEFGRSCSALQYLGASTWVDAFRRRMATWWASGFDLLVSPTLPEPPPPLGHFTPSRDNPVDTGMRASLFGCFTIPFNMTGQPAVSLPLGWSGDGLPIGVQLAAPYGREDLLVRVAAQLEAARPWVDRRPRLHA
jgi:amidase